MKDERNLDKFDQVFAHVFKGLESLPDAHARREIPEEWLKKLAEKYLTDEEKKQIEALGGWDKLMETLASGWKSRRAATRAATRWIGTGGTSPFGAYGYNPEGVRIGQDKGRHRSAVKVWDKREYRISTTPSNSAPATSRSRCAGCANWRAQGAPDELDLAGTIKDTANKGYLDLQMRPERRNAVKVLMFFDIGGSMDAHIKLVRGAVQRGEDRIQAPRIFLLPQLPL